MIGGHKLAHLKTNIEALSVQLTPQDVAEIEKGYDFDLGFPHNFINKAGTAPKGSQDATILASMGYFDYIEPVHPYKPHKGELNAPWKP